MYEAVCRNFSKDWYSQWSTKSPDIPTCFQFFDAPIYILIYLVLLVPYIIYLIRKKIHIRPILKLTALKLFFIICLLVLQILEVAIHTSWTMHDIAAYNVSNGCFMICMIIMVLILSLERKCNAMNSGYVFNYWLLHFLLFVVRSRTAVLDIKLRNVVGNYSREIFTFINFFFVTISLILSCFSEKMKDEEINVRSSSRTRSTRKVLKVDAETNNKCEKMELKEIIFEGTDLEGENNKRKDVNENIKESERLDECPEHYASYLARIMFSWFFPLIIKGYKRPLKHEDLWRLNKEDRCQTIVPILLKNLKRYLVIENNTKQRQTSLKTKERRSKRKIRELKGEAEKENLTNENNVSSTTEDSGKDSAKFDPCLFYALFRSHWLYFILTGLYKVVHDILYFLSPLLLKLLLQFVENPQGLIWKGYFIAALLLITSMIRTFVLHQYFHLVFKVGMQVRSSLISAVYRKSLLLNTTSRKDSTVGEIVNLMSIDSQKFQELIVYIHMIWSGPLQIIVALFLLWLELGPSVLAGLITMLLMIPITAVIGNIIRNIQAAQIKVTDSRIKLMNEVINGIKVLKLYAWEPSYIKFITDIRDEELGHMRRSAYLQGAVTFTFNCAPFLVSLISFGVFVLVSPQNILNAEKAFVSISLFNILRFPLMMFPLVISNLIQASVSLKRITTFLKRHEIDPGSVSHEKTPNVSSFIENGSFAWDTSYTEPTLKKINISFPENQLIAIVGPVGSGKSSILSALLGEIQKLEGRVNIHGSVGYVPQQSWIVNASVRDNILFGLPFDACKYQKVIKACCLERDLEMFKDSDFTEIGEKGINLSGGQKQRVSLARACYSDCQVFLFDDPLSAVDSHVGKRLIENVLSSNGMLNGFTRILVTHNLAVLPKCDHIIVMDNGSVSEQGTYADLIQHAGPFANFIATHLANDLKSDNNTGKMDKNELVEADTILRDLQRTVSLDSSNQSNSVLFSTLSKSREQIHKSMENIKQKSLEKSPSMESKNSDWREANCKKEMEKIGIYEKPKDANKLIEEEVTEVGNVKLSVYVAYLRSIGFWISGAVVILFLITQLFNLASNLWLVRWANDATISSNYSKTLESLIKTSQNRSEKQISEIQDFLNYQRNLNLGVYAALGLCQAIIQLFSSLAFAFATIKSSESFHKNLLMSVLRSPMTMFDSVPVGRIINRFSSDLNSVGTMLPQYINGFLVTAFSALVIFIMVTLPNGWILLPLTITLAFYVWIQRFYVASSRQIKRLESVSKSPIFSHFGETLQGVSSIRAYSLNEKFIELSDAKVDLNQCAYYANTVSNRWLAIILETIGNSIVFFAAIFSVLSVDISGMSPVNAGLVGLSVSYALNITQTLNWLVRMSSEVESNIVAVERIEEYSKMTPEAPWDNPDKKPDETWPQGMIQFVNYETKYREGLDAVLRNINFTIAPREKVGIVGRTGSGKSTLVLALFRILEKTKGEILIDGIPIHVLGLHDVRSRLTIIPQDPVLFSGTLRKNLDPFSKYSDDEIWKVLEMSNLKKFVLSSSNDQLEMIISEGGDNLSVGQKQLVCLARTLLRRTKILVLDEATAAVDLDTDVLIQETIRNEFKDSTIITIAHRLNTVIDYDRIIVLDNGSIAEIGNPQNLLKDSGSRFFMMAKSSNLV